MVPTELINRQGRGKHFNIEGATLWSLISFSITRRPTMVGPDGPENFENQQLQNPGKWIILSNFLVFFLVPKIGFYVKLSSILLQKRQQKPTESFHISLSYHK